MQQIKAQGVSKKKFLESTKKKGVVAYKNNIHKAKPLSEVCGHITAKKKYDVEDLICR